MTITEFLEARITEDEADAINRVVLRSTDRRSLTEDDAQRIHTECAAKREILESCSDILSSGGWEYSDAPDLAGTVIASLAAIYSEHPDYLQEWGA